MRPMTRTASPTIACLLLVVAFLLLFARPASAHHGAGAVDPRCAPGFPAEAGVDLSAICAEQASIGTQGDLDPGATKLMPFIGAMLVTGIALAVVAVVALRYRKPRARPSRPTAKAWWVCTSCHSMNGGDRATCYGCQAAAPSAVAIAHASATQGEPSDAVAPPAPAPAPALDQPVGRPAG
jgi:hypothetical protein